MSGIPSLPFAVGVYLPLSSSTPIFVGGMIRWMADRYVRKKHAGRDLTAEELTAEGDRAPASCWRPGHIAGGALGRDPDRVHRRGAGERADPDRRVVDGEQPGLRRRPHADLLSMVPFAALALVLHLVARERLFGRRTGVAT